MTLIVANKFFYWKLTDIIVENIIINFVFVLISIFSFVPVLVIWSMWAYGEPSGWCGGTASTWEVARVSDGGGDGARWRYSESFNGVRNKRSFPGPIWSVHAWCETRRPAVWSSHSLTGTQVVQPMDENEENDVV